MVYTLFATGGTWRFGPGDLPYHDLLGEAFLAGQLHLKVEPDPRLLTLPNPYDPSQNGPLRLHDASLYQGRYYLYWGPVPGLLHALWRLVTQAPLYASVVGVGAAILASASFWVILQRLRQRYFPSGAPWVIWGSSLAFALGGIMLYLVGRPSVYHEALLAAAGFLLPAWYSLLLAWEPGAPRRRYLLCSGVLLACAIGSRITYLMYAIGPGLVLGWMVLRAERRARWPALLDLVTFGVPVAVIGVLLLLYNVLRFGAPFEFGVPYVLQGSPSYYEMTRRPDGSTGSFFDPTVLAQNLALYLFAVPSLHAFYPYLAFAHTPYSGTGFLFPDVRQYAGSLVEPPVFSIFLLAPTSLLVLLTPRLFLGGRRPAPRPVSMWAAAVALGLVPMLVLLSSSRGVTVRYAIDILPAFSLLGTLVLLARSTPALDVSVLRTPVAGRIGTPALGGKQATLLFALSSWGLSLVFGLMLGLGVWRYSFPAQALRTQAISDEWLGRWSSVVRPDTVPSSTAPTGRTSWRSVDGHYLKGGTIYLRVPGPGMVLILRFTSELPAGSELAVTLNGETVMRGPMLDDQQLWWTPPLTGESQGAVVPIRLDLPSRASMAPGSRMPLVVSSLRFARPDDIDLYRGPQAR